MPHMDRKQSTERSTQNSDNSLPVIIQGGMGVGVSSWSLARAVSMAGHLGVVSGTAVDVTFVRKLQHGDIGGHIRRGLSHFPIPGVAQRILDRYFIDGGKSSEDPYKAKPVPSVKPSKGLQELLVASNFVEVFLAREGHNAPIGINYLEKIQLPTLPSIYGAMLAGVAYILMGAGIPRAIPGVLDRFAKQRSAELRIDVKGADYDDIFTTSFDPNTFCEGNAPNLVRPDFIAIVSSSTLATMLSRKASGKVNGFVIEGPTAGGHNAPPRGKIQLSANGEPLYGERDVPDLVKIKALGLPFWLAGSYAEPEHLAEAIRLGATGVQIGTAFAYCEESGLDYELKKRVMEMSLAGVAEIFTDPVASPTGFPFKVLQMENTNSDQAIYKQRSRICDLGYLRHAYKKPNGKLGWRCPAEPVEDYIRKGGDVKDTVGRKCCCNGLMANIGYGQIQRGGELEKPLITSGDDVTHIARFLKSNATSYKAVDVIEYMMRDSISATNTLQEECIAI